MEEVKIMFPDGSEVRAERNGSSYITAGKPDFPEDLSAVTVHGEGGEDKAYKNARLVECASTDGRYWFSFAEASELDLWRAEIEDAICDMSR